MKKSFLLLLVLPAAYCCMAQDTSDTAKASQASQEYHNSRLKDSYPQFNLPKIEGLVAAIKKTPADGDDGEIIAPDQKTYLALSLRERFTYHMIHPESYSQNCDGGLPATADEEKKIFGELPDGFDEYSWSSRQRKFFLANRDSVIAFMKYCITADKTIGLNFKQVITDINAQELIPLIIDTYNLTKKDHDLLTVLLLLMRDNEYAPFLVSASYKKLYAGDDAGYKAFLNFNSENEALILKRAADFFNTLAK